PRKSPKCCVSMVWLSSPRTSVGASTKCPGISFNSTIPDSTFCSIRPWVFRRSNLARECPWSAGLPTIAMPTMRAERSRIFTVHRTSSPGKLHRCRLVELAASNGGRRSVFPTQPVHHGASYPAQPLAPVGGEHQQPEDLARYLLQVTEQPQARDPRGPP